jgi:lysophospholipase L1-like esterase
MLLKAKQKLVMIGDSITDVGRTQPVGEGLFEPYGKGYVNLVNALLGSVYPELAIRVVNVGCSGNTTRDLKSRWQRDVLDLKPNWVSCMIGTNDVWRQFDTPWQKEWHVQPDEYRANLEALVQLTKDKVEGMVLLTPFYIEPNKDDNMRAQMDRYGAVVKEVAAQHKTLCVDTQAAFDRLMSHYYPATLAWDRVHPTSIGHMAIARAFLATIGFQWN